MVAGRLTVCYGIIVPEDGCGRRAAGSVIGLGVIIREGLDRSHWLVGTLISVWRGGACRWGRV